MKYLLRKDTTPYTIEMVGATAQIKLTVSPLESEAHTITYETMTIPNRISIPKFFTLFLL